MQHGATVKIAYLCIRTPPISFAVPVCGCCCSVGNFTPFNFSKGAAWISGKYFQNTNIFIVFV